MSQVLRAATIDNVAKQAGVAKATVSRAMRGSPGIAKATRERVLLAARDLNYRPSLTRQTRGRTRTGQVGFLAISELPPRMEGQIGGSYLDAILHGCLAYAEQAETSVVICRMSFEQVEKGEWPTALRRGQLDGVVLRGWWQPQVSSWLKENKVPCVLVDCDQYVPSLPQVQIENIQAMDSLVAYLTESGSKRFATITGDMEHLNAQERLAGLQMALVRRGLTLPPDQIAIEHGFDEVSGQRGVQTLLGRNVSFDTLVCQNDLVAYGALQALKQAGVVVPDQVRLTGFDKMDVVHRFDVPITTVDPQPDALGREGVKLLLQIIEGGSHQPVHLRLPAKLVVRT